MKKNNLIIILLSLLLILLTGCSKESIPPVESMQDINFIEINKEQIILPCIVDDLLQSNLNLLDTIDKNKEILPKETGSLCLKDKYENNYFIEYQNTQDKNCKLKDCNVTRIQFINSQNKDTKVNLGGLLIIGESNYILLEDIENPLYEVKAKANSKLIYEINQNDTNIVIDLNFDNDNLLYDFDLRFKY